MQRFKTLRQQLYRRILIIAIFALVGLSLGATRSEAGRIVVKVKPARYHRPAATRVVVVKSTPRRVWKAGHWQYRPALGRSVWVQGHWVTVR
jgi:hypothetical protein